MLRAGVRRRQFLREQQRLPRPAGDARNRAVATLFEFCAGADDLPIEARNAIGGPARNLEIHIGHAEAHGTKAHGIGRMAAQAIAPGTGDGNKTIRIAHAEGRARKILGDLAQARTQGIKIRHDKPGENARRDNGGASGQVELAVANIHPHVARARHHEGVACEAKA